MKKFGFPRLIAELIGTAILAVTVGVVSVELSQGLQGLYGPFAVGAALMLVVYFFGHVSGAHCNPAVSVAQFAFRKLSVNQLLLALLGQLLGALLGVWLTYALLHMHATMPESPPELKYNWHGVLAEILGTSVLP